MNPRRLLSLVFAVLTAVSAVAVVGPTPRADAATSFGGWQFTASVSSFRSDGMSLSDVSYDGLKIFDRVSMPAMTVYYDSSCGPYVDRIGGSSYDLEAPTEFTVDGVRWLQIGITDYIGAYVISQMFYLSEEGDFDVHIFSKGLQCNIRHDHYPFIRLDFDIAGTGTDHIRRATNGGTVTMTNEFSMRATAAVDHGWEVRDALTGDVVSIDFDDNNAGFAGEEVRPREDYVDNYVYGRRAKPNEDRWLVGARQQLFGDEGEPIGDDAIVWYRGYMPHSPEEGPNLWHSTGIRMKVNPVTGPGVIAGTVTDLSGRPVSGLQVDLFSEGRVEFLGAATTDGTGRFSFEVEPGCNVLTFIAPDGATMVGGGRYLNRSTCVDAGSVSAGNDAVVELPGSGEASVGGRVTNVAGQPIAGVKANLFTQGRSEFLGLAITGDDGSYVFELASPMCGVVTLIAPQGDTFLNGERFANASFCANAGDAVVGIDATVADGASAGIAGRITDSAGSGVAGVRAVVYLANGDGSRGQWLGFAATDTGGRFSYTVASACHVIDLVAPNGRTWISTGGRFYQRSACPEAGGVVDGIDGVLSG